MTMTYSEKMTLLNEKIALLRKLDLIIARTGYNTSTHIEIERDKAAAAILQLEESLLIKKVDSNVPEVAHQAQEEEREALKRQRADYEENQRREKQQQYSFFEDSQREESIKAQMQLLVTYRRTLMYSINQANVFGGVHLAPINVQHQIRESRNGIADCKQYLRGLGVAVQDNKDDEEPQLEGE